MASRSSQPSATACHTAGVAGAPKLGDLQAWGPRIATGYDALLHSALTGKGAMGPQGGGDFTDLEIGRAVVYIDQQGRREVRGAEDGRRTTSTAKVNEGGDAAAAAAVAAAKTAMAGVKSTAAHRDGTAAPAARGHRRRARVVHAGLPGLPCRRRGRCTQGRRQGGVGATPRTRHDG
jgi:hypothetical protein